MEIYIEYNEYECTGCSVNGCGGHTTDEPIAIVLDGVRFYVDGFYEGDYPSQHRPEDVQEVKSVIARLQTITQQQLSTIKTSCI